MCEPSSAPVREVGAFSSPSSSTLTSECENTNLTEGKTNLFFTNEAHPPFFASLRWISCMNEVDPETLRVRISRERRKARGGAGGQEPPKIRSHRRKVEATLTFIVGGAGGPRLSVCLSAHLSVYLPPRPPVCLYSPTGDGVLLDACWVCRLRGGGGGGRELMMEGKRKG